MLIYTVRMMKMCLIIGKKTIAAFWLIFQSVVHTPHNSTIPQSHSDDSWTTFILCGQRKKSKIRLTMRSKSRQYVCEQNGFTDFKNDCLSVIGCSSSGILSSVSVSHNKSGFLKVFSLTI